MKLKYDKGRAYFDPEEVKNTMIESFTRELNDVLQKCMGEYNGNVVCLSCGREPGREGESSESRLDLGEWRKVIRDMYQDAGLWACEHPSFIDGARHALQTLLLHLDSPERPKG